MFYDIQLKPITTVRALIALDEQQMQDIIANPQPFVNDPAALLRKSKQPTAAPPVKSKRAAKQTKPVVKKGKKPIINCRYCKAPFINPGSRDKHEDRCIDNQNNASTPVEE